jgi:hypothetical protein
MNTEPEPDKSRIIEKIAKLKARLEHVATGGQVGQSEAELEAVAEAMRRLLATHKLTMTDVEFATQERVEPVSQYAVNHRKFDPDWKPKSKRTDWEERLASIVAKAHFCQIIVHRSSNRLSLVGRRSDAEVAEYMIVTLTRSIARVADDAYGKYARLCLKRGDVTEARGFRLAFLRAFVMRLAARYAAEQKAQEGESSTALVRFDAARQAVADFVKEPGRFKMMRAPVGREAHNAEGHRQGTAAADSVSLKANAVKGATTRGELR